MKNATTFQRIFNKIRIAGHVVSGHGRFRAAGPHSAPHSVSNNAGEVLAQAGHVGFHFAKLAPHLGEAVCDRT